MNKRNNLSLPRLIGFIVFHIIFTLPICLIMLALYFILGLMALIATSAPLIAIIDFMLAGVYSGSEFFLSITICGFGILLLIAVYLLMRPIRRLCRRYYIWNLRTWFRPR
ncbi:DUF1700 domain-containing protein [Paenibacillus sp. N1-5-1-14]|uniref:DUF1700 domain-containing protein n=1 Tax=Paenibacillus radicibacter TaxID=2972488 RepID=UPI0021591729|nr:DUF1700 domain-containing protein [Paenibacillus radicibacter]MCR8641339.1 DUF1700 domain-containing protein [Paenibacillus radicibacter]